MMKKIIAVVLMMVIAAMCLTACGSKPAPAKEADLNAVMASFNLGEDMMSLDADDLLDAYGIKSVDVKQFAAMTSTGLECDEIVLIEAVDADAAGRIKTALETRYQAKVDQTVNYQPDQYAIIKECSVTTNGNYVAMIVSANASDLTKTYTAAIQ